MQAAYKKSGYSGAAAPTLSKWYRLTKHAERDTTSKHTLGTLPSARDRYTIKPFWVFGHIYKKFEQSGVLTPTLSIQ